MRRTAFELAATLLLGTGISATRAANPPNAEDLAFFRERVAPILEKRCVSCHGPVGPKGGLVLTSLEDVNKGGGLGPALVAGSAEQSLLIEKVSGDSPEMPKKAEPLSNEQVADLRRWIDRGAAWPEGLTLRDRHLEGVAWWAFAPLVRPAVPAVMTNDWARTPIDAFILAQLEKNGLHPSPEADRRVLIRRLTFDLHGLPPTPAEIDAFLADKAPDAYEKLVDRLLASPRYGERWGRHWLDVVHYGDTHGYDKDKRRDHAWPYRDYVISSLNADIPYRRFIQDQIAGDVLFPGEPASLIATGFVAAGPWDFVGHVELREGTVDKLKARLNDRDDMLANTMSTFQSMTVHCARCHDHKFDPIPQKDYYKLQAVFAGVDRGDRAYATRELDLKQRELEARRQNLLDRHRTVLKTINESVANHPELAKLDLRSNELQQKLIANPKPAADLEHPSPTNGYHSDIHDKSETSTWVQVDLGKSEPISTIRLVPARPVDFPDTPGFGFPARFKVEVSNDPEFDPKTAKLVETTDYVDTDATNDEPRAIRFEPISARYVRITAHRLWKRTDDYVFALAELEVIANEMNVARGKPVKSPESIESGRWSRSALVDGFDSRYRRPAMVTGAALEREKTLAEMRRFKPERARLIDETIDPALRTERDRLAQELAAVDRSLKQLKPSEMVYALKPHAPRPIQLLKRGDVEQPGEAVDPGALSCLPGLESDFSLSNAEDEGARRAALAGWLTSDRNVLTWRSIVNRVWHFHFGKGIVDTPNDFGRNGSKPTHPELLDWLAVEFLEHGQTFKDLHRLILRSAVYRQVSKGDKTAERIDADNRLLWRMNRARLDAESVRDSVLAISETLDSTMGGPGFDLFKFKDDHSPIYDHTAPGVSDHPGVRRRTIYRFVVRSVPNPFLESLDCADPNINTPVRPTTITALQALALYNDPFIATQSREFASRLDREGGTLDGKIDSAYRLALGRLPRPDERQEILKYAKSYGLAAACHVLLNTNEFMFVD